ncbi:hypothetical protein HYX17_01475 [Candidatus Woesearchaeota archaeon]|nr:hypothetical protein [Candidatus Woesearchaeota archaeon]
MKIKEVWNDFKKDFTNNKKSYIVCGSIGGIVYNLIGLTTFLPTYTFFLMGESIEFTGSFMDFFIFIPLMIMYVIRNIIISLIISTNNPFIFLLFYPTYYLGLIIILLLNFVFGFLLISLVIYITRRIFKKHV